MKKLIILVITGFAFLFSPILDVKAVESEKNVYEQDFSDILSVREDFTAYYVYTLGGSSEDDMIFPSYDESARWYLDGNSIVRKAVNGDINLSLDTSSIGVLTYTKKKFVNFELTVDYCSGSTTYYWPVIAFRQREAGKYYLSDGAGVFVQNGGKVTLWGADGVGGPYETSGINSYSNNTWHTMMVRVDGINLSVYIDGSNTPQFTKTLPRTFFRSGYISLVSVNNDCKFRNFKVVELPTKPLEDGYQQKSSLDSTSPNSLDVLAGEKLESLDEMDYVTSVSNVTEKENNGCAGSVVATAFSTIALCSLLFICKRKKNKQ